MPGSPPQRSKEDLFLFGQLTTDGGTHVPGYPPTPARDFSLIVQELLSHHEDEKNWNPQWLSPWVPPLSCLQVPSGAHNELEGLSVFPGGKLPPAGITVTLLRLP